jgi:hypothetical protein
MCIDANRADSLVDSLFTQYNVQFPSWVVKIFTKVFWLFSIDGFAIFSGQTSISGNTEYNIQQALRVKFPTFDITKDVVKYIC